MGGRPQKKCEEDYSTKQPHGVITPQISQVVTTTVAVTRGWNTYNLKVNKMICSLSNQTCVSNPGWGNGPNIPWSRDYIDHGNSGC